MAYRTCVTVRFGDVDKAGIVYQPVIHHYLHIAMEEFFGDFIGIPYHELVGPERIGFPAVADSNSYLRPMKYGDILEIKVYVSRVGKTSVTLEFEVARKETGELLARSTQTRVTVNMDTWEPIPIPDRYRERLASCGPD